MDKNAANDNHPCDKLNISFEIFHKKKEADLIKSYRWQMMHILLGSFYLILMIYFTHTIYQTTYLGIRAYQINDEWFIKRIYDGGLGADTSLQINDQLVELDGNLPKENKQLTNWLVVEQINSLTIQREQQRITYRFDSPKTFLPIFFTLLAFSGSLVLFLLFFYRKQLLSKRSRLFYLWLFVFAFIFLAAFPSSIGNTLGRVILIISLSTFPFFLNSFLKINSAYKISNIGIFPALLLLLNLAATCYAAFFQIGYVLAEYLAVGFVYSLMLVMLGEYCFSFFNKSHKKHRTATKVNLPVILFVSSAPFLYLYAFPIGWSAPYYLLVFFIFLPFIGIFHRLAIDRVLKFRYRITTRSIYLILSLFLTVIVIFISQLNAYVPNLLIILYLFLLIYTLLPLLQELFYLASRHNEPMNSLDVFLAVEKERETISSYIHDGIIQEIIHLLRQIENDRQTVPKEKIIQQLDELIYDLRELCSDIYPLLLQEIGLEKTLASLFVQIQQNHPVLIHFAYDRTIHSDSPEINNFILRSVKELLNNSILHGHATELIITNAVEDDTVVFEISDNGTFGQDSLSKGPHFGLNVIKEKLSLLSGRFVIHYSPTTIQLRIPKNIFEGANYAD
ncbi:sensor histidine kinase [Enterococcus sp. AZ173]|uniref:sensor histidine kinase n=2 Tax=Enterococcus TaxID=1350 RepID=UPI003D2BD3EC